MKAKLIKYLNKDETQDFRKSNLFELINRNWATTDSFIEYNCEYFGENYNNFSIVVYEKDIFYIALYIFSNNQIINYFGQPVTIFNIGDHSDKLSLAFKTLFLKLDELKKTHNFNSLLFYSNPILLSKYIESQILSEIEFEAFVDLNQSEELIRANVRKSYKSLINWGVSNLTIIIMNKSNLNKEMFDNFKLLHIKVSGRQTRSDYSWEIQFKAIKDEKAFLVLGYYLDRLVSGAYIIHGTEVGYYGVAVNDRELMAENLSLGHAVLFKSIIYAKEIGLKKFLLGNLENTTDVKIIDIIKYKKGFTNSLGCKTKHLIKL